MASDPKKVQTLINVCGQQMVTIRAALQTMQDMKATFQAVNPDVTGTPLEGNLTTLNNALTALQGEVDKAVWTALMNANVPTHKNKAL